MTTFREMRANFLTELRGVNLDDNALTEYPSDLDAVGLTNASYLSMANNSVTTLNSSLHSGLFSVVILDHNQIERLPDPIVTLDCYPPTTVDSYDCNCGFAYVSIKNNAIVTLQENGLFAYGSMEDCGGEHSSLSLQLDNNNIEMIPSRLLYVTNASSANNLNLSLANNSISIIQMEMVSVRPGGGIVTLEMHIEDNKLVSLPTQLLEPSVTYGGGGVIQYLQIFFDDNNLETLPDGLLTGTSSILKGVSISLQRNNIVNVGSFFDGFAHPDTAFINNYFDYLPLVVEVKLQDNRINGNGLSALMGSFMQAEKAVLRVDLHRNNLTQLAENTFAGFGSSVTASSSYSSTVVTLDENSVLDISPYFFTVDAYSEGPDRYLHANSITVNMNNMTDLVLPSSFFNFLATEVVELNVNMINSSLVVLPIQAFTLFHGAIAQPGQIPAEAVLNLDFSNNRLNPESFAYPIGSPGSTFFDPTIPPLDQTPISFMETTTVNVKIRQNGISYIPPNSFGGFTGLVDLGDNELTLLGPGAFNNSLVTSVQLDHNRIQMLSDSAFNLSRYLVTLNLSNNNITQLSEKFTANTPVLSLMDINNNQLVALPESVGNSRMFEANAKNNIIHCDTYFPILSGCSCNQTGLVYSSFCGYGRCYKSISGCPANYHAKSSCAGAPQSACILKCPTGQFLSENTLAENEATCTPYTACKTAFLADSGTAIPAYEFKPPTITSDRVCAPCSVCPAGFDTSPCTATSNAVCTKVDKLTPGDIAAIIFSMLFIFFTGIGGTSYFFLRKKKAKTDEELELSQLLLSDVTEDNERMKLAWEIDEADLSFEKRLAAGSFGEVWGARWGHIDVAVKLLHAHLAEFTEELEDFNKEATFMQSIRHPNLLTFYGAGIRSDGTPFLVVEMMEKGSMRTILREQKLEWPTRRRFACEIAAGMAHLHGLESMHRDLKSDNCLVDNKFHVKVCDFGAGRLRTRKQRLDPHVDTWGNKSKSLTAGVGTPLWMAPELVIQGKNRQYTNAVDVYSFGIVMWELLTCKTPWDEEIEDTNMFKFRAALEEALANGQRPTLPKYTDESTYASYVSLMKQCWATDPDDRPTFGSVSGLLSMQETLG